MLIKTTCLFQFNVTMSVISIIGIMFYSLFSDFQLFSSENQLNSFWHHFQFTLKNEGSGLGCVFCQLIIVYSSHAL